MSAIDFCDLAGQPLVPGLGRLLEPLVAAGERAVVLVGSPERLEALNAGLWTYDPASFLPHGSAADGYPDRQPVWLTTVEENPNGPSTLVFLEEGEPSRLDVFARYLFLFDRTSPDGREGGRERWRRYRDAGHALRYCEKTAEGWRAN